MASSVSTAATLSRSTIAIPIISVANPWSNCGCPNLIGPFTILDTAPALSVNTLTKLQPLDFATVPFFHQTRPLALCTTSVVTRAYAGDNTDSGNSLDDDDDDDDDYDDDDDDKNDGEAIEQDGNDIPIESEIEGEGIEIKIEKTGKNSRRIRSKVGVQASLQCVWDILTDYERLADFIPSLSVSQLLEKRDNFARLFQIGQQDLAFGLKFNAKGTIDCFEKDLQTLPFSQKRDIDFKMVEGDFQIFEGKWSVEQEMKGDIQIDPVVSQQESQTALVYVVDVKPKLWLPVRLVEGRLCKEIKMNLSCIRDEAEKAFRNTHSSL